jgi:hypothetical protein
VPLSSRTEFFVHYDGAHHVTKTGYAVPRAIEAQHLAQGWSGVGYHFVVDQAGNIYEGRGWTRQGAHCPGHNVSGIGVQIAIGGDQKPTEAALAACRALYDEACRKTGRTLAKKGHRDGIATQCPGSLLYAWVKAGMPAESYQPPTDGTSSGSSGTSSAYKPPAFPASLAPNKAKPSAVTLQRALKKAGYMPTSVKESPNYGPATQAAVAKFHNAHPQYRAQGVTRDPAIGPKGWAVLFRLAYGK